MFMQLADILVKYIPNERKMQITVCFMLFNYNYWTLATLFNMFNTLATWEAALVSVLKSFVTDYFTKCNRQHCFYPQIGKKLKLWGRGISNNVQAVAHKKYIILDSANNLLQKKHKLRSIALLASFTAPSSYTSMSD